MNSMLDNPIWNALTTIDSHKNIGSKNVGFFDVEIAPFIGLPDWDKNHQLELIKKAPDDRNWFLLISHEVHFIDALEIAFSLPLYQFTCSKLNHEPVTKRKIEMVPLNENHIDEMIALTQLTKPGPFAKRTIEFGGYYGMFEDHKLVTIGGERLHMNGFTEISAICTHPDYQGLGYGAKMTQFLAQTVLNKGQTPFLHVRYDNFKAIEMYQRLGFEKRANIYFYIIKKRS
ncbi:GNAT family N-acetyltransferase [Yeosuana sp. AK3]